MYFRHVLGDLLLRLHDESSTHQHGFGIYHCVPYRIVSIGSVHHARIPNDFRIHPWNDNRESDQRNDHDALPGPQGFEFDVDFAEIPVSPHVSVAIPVATTRLVSRLDYGYCCFRIPCPS